MSRIQPVPLEQLPASLAGLLQKGVSSGVLSSTVPLQVWANSPSHAQGWLALLDLFHSDSSLPERLRELVRLKIAGITNCRACQVARKSDQVSEEEVACLSADDDRFSAGEQAAIRFAQLFASDYTAIDEGHFAALRQHFSLEQLTELNMYCALMLAGGRMTFVQQAY
ncbi:alkylhydroperoxidase AhpD family core domain-containing protein [Halopseudomonas sabulinigri]|uniref:Alkylhydroperoxidase AhpD family core domain-containing protein n=1 Tax=Halopseudomonas sabulinigri TaxID=472181 RepID=A0A1H1VXL7_9GAMM|nr:carboxymuconolactone decarboxylase family protein [Halopseudomonas sabulinigri]SDS88809.1 alkylhydroperoxidase AhpD family core domain-containing protein [Halopseudomonas sabulinigri]